MAQRTLQKSFSEQDHSANAKHRQQWQRNKTYQGRSSEGLSGFSKGKGEKSPLAVSTITKNKLNSFVHKPVPTAVEEKKGIHTSWSRADDKENVPLSQLQQAQKQMEVMLEKQSTSEKSRPVPSTPGDKLALPDLTAMADTKRETTLVSPEDRLLWDVEGRSIPFLKELPYGQKRARSSSPIPVISPQIHAGPDFDIWRSHSLKGSDFEQIMQTSSPQHVTDGQTPRSVAVWKRTQSLGNNHYMPSTKRIRRKSPERATNSPAEKAQRSKLSTFIENLQRNFTESAQPIPAMIGAEAKPSIEEGTNLQPPKNGQRFSEHAKDSDYGSDDDFGSLDENILTIFESTQATPLRTKRVLPHQKPTFKPPSDATIATTSMPALTNKAKAKVISRTDEEEFDDGTNDADFDEVLVGPAFPSVDQIRSTKEENLSRPMDVCRASVADSDDEFGNDLDITDFEAAEVAASQSLQGVWSSMRPSTQMVQAIQRYLVTHVLDSEYDGPHGGMQKEKLLIVQNEDTKATRTIHLRGSWIETPATVKAYVHIIGTFEKNGRCVIDDAHNMIILHPDHLLSSTVVADSFGCTRRAVLQDRVKATSEANKSLVYGTILHELFQAAMVQNRWDLQYLSDILEQITRFHIEDLYKIKVTLSDASEHLRSKLSELQSWAELFVTSKPKPQAIVQAGNGEKASMCISKLLDVEEHVWSPMYGLKGNIDATVQVTMQDGKQLRTLTVPFEVKTGKTASAAHRAQTALYNLLLSDRYDIDIAYGILYYMETSETIRIPAIRHELRHMIMQRNELACFVRERNAQLPPMLKKDSMCGRCYAKIPCFIYHKLADDGDGETSGMNHKFDEIVKHLTPGHKEFFLRWDDLLTKEEKESLKFRRELWTMLSSEREQRGRCFANVIIEPDSAVEDKETPKINRYQYTMIKDKPTPKFSFLDSQITVGEPIVISDEKGHFALANGYVINVRKKRIIVAVDRRLHNARIRQPGFDMVDNQVFASIMEVAEEDSSFHDAELKLHSRPILYRLDKDEFSNGMATVRNNLVQIMAEGPFGSREIRNLVVDLKEPQFKPKSTQYVLKDRASLNIDQRRAIEKVMSAQDYALILGMPGTGKTTTIAHIIRALVSQGKSVLLTSYTHTAVDNILLKLKDDQISILRLGTAAKINKDVQEFAKLATSTRTTFEEIQEDWLKTPVVATTCLGINHPLFNERSFDYCIVDEASQITLPVCLGPIRMAKTFILVGDHNQLPPLVQNEAARIGGLDISLFKYLSDAHPASVVYLEHQYRMCADVMALSNSLIYNGRLKCGSVEVANRRLHIPHLDALRLHHHTPSSLARLTSTGQYPNTICPSIGHSTCWLHHVLMPSTTITFLNTDSLLPQAHEVARGARLINPLEATLCAQLVLSLLSVGVAASSIGVMTHYRSQLALLKDCLRMHPDIEMHTADRFQGRDKDVVVLSLVRSNAEGKIGELLRDWRRINVAFTRAKTKLIVIGSRETLSGCINVPDTERANKANNDNGADMARDEEMVAKFVKFMEGKGWIYELPSGAQNMHYFEETASQTQLSAVSHSAEGGIWAATQGLVVKDIESPALGAKMLERKRPILGELGGTANEGVRKHNPKRIRGGKTMDSLRQGTVLGDILNEMN